MYPFLITVPHGGTEVPESIRPRIRLEEGEIRYYSDPRTREVFGFRRRVAGYIDTPVSRMVVDLNRPPLPLPPRDPDGIIKVRTIDGREVYKPGQVPNIHLIHDLLRTYYFPFHQQVDEILDSRKVRVAFDCHSMLPVGSSFQKDAGRVRPLVCLGNNGDRSGRARRGSISTCPAEWIRSLSERFREELPPDNRISINDPFSAGFISNAHFWHKGIPWIQIEINRSLYESGGAEGKADRSAKYRSTRLREKIWNVLTSFWDQI